MPLAPVLGCLVQRHNRVAEESHELGPDATPEAVAARFEGVSVEAVGDVMEVVRG